MFLSKRTFGDYSKIIFFCFVGPFQNYFKMPLVYICVELHTKYFDFGSEITLRLPFDDPSMKILSNNRVYHRSCARQFLMQICDSDDRFAVFSWPVYK